MATFLTFDESHDFYVIWVGYLGPIHLKKLNICYFIANQFFL